MLYFQILIKLVQLTSLTMIQTTAKVNLQTGTTETVNITKGLEQGYVLAPTLFNLALEYVIRKLSIERSATLEHNGLDGRICRRY